MTDKRPITAIITVFALILIAGTMLAIAKRGDRLTLIIFSVAIIIVLFVLGVISEKKMTVP
jgi:hypothetical protein